MSRLKLYKVNVVRLGVFAPAIYLDASSKTEAKQLAQQKSRLSNFDGWGFFPHEIKK